MDLAELFLFGIMAKASGRWNKMKCEVKVLKPRLMSGERINDTKIMYVNPSEKVFWLFGGQYEIIKEVKE